MSFPWRHAAPAVPAPHRAMPRRTRRVQGRRGWDFLCGGAVKTWAHAGRRPSRPHKNPHLWRLQTKSIGRVGARWQPAAGHKKPHLGGVASLPRRSRATSRGHACATVGFARTRPETCRVPWRHAPVSALHRGAACLAWRQRELGFFVRVKSPVQGVARRHKNPHLDGPSGDAGVRCVRARLPALAMPCMPRTKNRTLPADALTDRRHCSASARSAGSALSAGKRPLGDCLIRLCAASKLS